MGVDWGGPAAWEHRRPEFRSVYELQGVRPIPAMTFMPESTAAGHWNETRTLWRSLPDKPHLLRALQDDNRLLSLRYAALHWKHPPIEDDSRSQRKRGAVTLACWGVQLVRVFAMIRDTVEHDAWRYLMQPFAIPDLAGDLRVGFLPAGDASPPEPKLDERSLVFAVGTLLSTLTSGNGAIGNVIRRCTDEKPRRRFASLAALEEQFTAVLRIDVRL